MPPKKASTAGAKKSAPAAQHASYQDMIKEAIINLKERNGSSRQALKKYVLVNNQLGNVKDAQFTSLFNRALAKGSDDGVFARPKGPSGPVKLAKPDPAKAAKPAASKTATKKTTKTTKKEDDAAAPKKTTKATTKKAPAAKKASTKATTKATTKTTKATTKKAPAAKANTSKKAAPKAAPAVEEEKPVVLTKTKTGRVVKSAQPQKTKKAAAPKKAATTKKAAAKK
ncbi:hypothetical protein WHR41_04284 [Cladosporium halotolerans]|uniref:Histone H1 n=1 Tax=Cladosporium halotolerans TaxID=1052096 RepID=A0AB34KVA1_9PEZI